MLCDGRSFGQAGDAAERRYCICFFFSVKCDFLYLFLTRYLYELELIFQVNAQVFSKIMLRVAGSIAVEIFLT